MLKRPGKSKTNLITLRESGLKAVDGKVRIEYRDAITGKVNERMDKKNHVFEDAFEVSNYMNILSATGLPTFFMTDSDIPADDNFQFLRGNIIGYAQNGNINGSGSYFGAYVPSQSFNAQPLSENEGYGFKWKYVYDFSAAQILEPVKSFGITTQYSNPYTANLTGVPFKRVPVTGYYYSVTKNQKTYSITDDGNVRIYDAIRNKDIRNINISAITGTASSLNIGVNARNAKMYVFAYSSTAANRLMYEFADDTFTTLLNTYPCSAITTYPSTSKNFIVVEEDTAGAGMHYWNGNWIRANFFTNTNGLTGSYPSGQPYIDTLLTGNAVSLLCKDGLGYVVSDYYATTLARTLVRDIENNAYVTSLCANNKAASSTTQAIVTENPFSENGPVMFTSQTNGFLSYKGALTCFVVPDDYPPRPEGQSMRITYEIDVAYL